MFCDITFALIQMKVRFIGKLSRVLRYQPCVNSSEGVVQWEHLCRAQWFRGRTSALH